MAGIPVDVKDAARCNVLALSSNLDDKFYNVGTGVQTSIKELCDKILKMKNSNLSVKYNPYDKEDARRMVQNRIGCPNKARKELNFNYHYDLDEGLKRLIEWRESSS